MRQSPTLPPPPHVGVGEEVENAVKEVSICQLQSCSMLNVPILLGDLPLRAIIDTAAGITIISDQVHNRLIPRPPRIREVTLHTAGRDMKMAGFVVALVGPVSMKLGGCTFEEEICVVPIEDEMLLGLD